MSSSPPSAAARAWNQAPTPGDALSLQTYLQQGHGYYKVSDIKGIVGYTVMEFTSVGYQVAPSSNGLRRNGEGKSRGAATEHTCIEDRGNGYFDVILHIKDIKGITKMNFRDHNDLAMLIRDSPHMNKRANRWDAKPIGIDLG